jgi:hypothetical protein
MKLIAINRQTGMRAGEGEAGVIMEAFKPGTGPADSYWVIGGLAGERERAAISPSASRRDLCRAAAASTDGLSETRFTSPLQRRGMEIWSAAIHPSHPFRKSRQLPCARKPKILSTRSSRPSAC